MHKGKAVELVHLDHLDLDREHLVWAGHKVEDKDPVVGCCMRVAYHTDPAAHNLAGKLKVDVGRAPGCHTWVHHNHE